MKILVLSLFALSFAVVYNIEDTDSVYINPGGSISLQASSNPSLGYIWYLISTTSEKLTIQSPTGEYSPPQDDSETRGTTTFTVSCANNCEVGETIEVIAALQNSWEVAPFDVKRIAVQVTNNKLN